MHRIPLEAELFSAVLARVSYQLILLDYRRNRFAYERPSVAIGALAARLLNGGFVSLSIWVDEAGYFLMRGYSIREWVVYIVTQSRLVQRHEQQRLSLIRPPEPPCL